MKTSISSRIIGFGRYAPERRVHNSELESRLGLAPGWIERRTGIRSRRYAAHDEALTDLAFRAGAAALASSTLTPSEFGLTLLATSTPDHLLPPSAPLLADRLGLALAGAIDLTGACAGFIYALVLADGFVRSQRRPVLVVAANVLSRRINPDDRTSSILFGDAAGALALAPSDDPATGVLGVDLFSAGAHYDLICIPAGGSRKPFSQDMPLTDIFMRMPDGKAIFSLAVEMMTKSSRHALNMAGLTAANITRFAPHQANGRIIDAVRRNLCLPEATLVSTIAEFGNSSAATIPFSLAASSEAAPFQPGERILLTAVGAGMTGGAAVVGF